MFVICIKIGSLFIENMNCSYVGESSVIMYLNVQCSDQQDQFQSSNCNTSISQLSRFPSYITPSCRQSGEKLGILVMTCR
jgi:hypothetical protein